MQKVSHSYSLIVNSIRDLSNLIFIVLGIYLINIGNLEASSFVVLYMYKDKVLGLLRYFVRVVEHIKELCNLGIDSFKVEGRTKSLYYVSAVAKTYRKAIDDYCNTGKLDEEFLFNELLKVGNRGYTTGFFIDKPNSDGYSYDISKGLAGADYLFYVMGFETDYYKVKIKNKVLVGDEIEVITPDNIYNLKVLEIKSEKGEIVDVANTNDECYMKFSQNFDDYKYALARTIGIKNVR
jgi:putative protease